MNKKQKSQELTTSPSSIFIGFGFLFFCSFFFLLGLAEAENSTSSPKPLKIGVILPLSGTSASIGVSVKNGMMLAYEKLPEATKNKFELVFEDDQLDPVKTVSAFQKLTSVDKIDLLLTGYSGPSKAVAPLAEQKKIPQLAIASDPEIPRNKKYVMNFWVTPEEEGRAALAEALKRGYKRIARITTIQQGFVSIKAAFDKQNNDSLKVVLDEEYNPEVRDFKTFLTNVKSRKDIDAIMVLLMVNGQCGIFAKQAKEMGISLPLFGIENFEDANEQKVAKGALENHWYTINDDPSGDFLSEYQKRFSDASIFAAGNGHDALLLLATSIETNPNSEAINDYLHKLKDFHGVLGAFSATDDNRFSLPATVKVVTQTGVKKLN